jgi:hypothetical protein
MSQTLDDVRRDRERGYARSSVYMQTLAQSARHTTDAKILEMVRCGVSRADNEALKVRLADCVVARPASRATPLVVEDESP